ncbi:SusC/RagA family TonB-linked outer membrane protein [Parabacteroides sp.]
MRRKVLAFITMLFTIVCAVSAQTITVNGNIVDESNEPVIGASVLVEGTNIGTISDIDGNFSLMNVPSKAQLKISYVGMATQTVKAAPKVKIMLIADAQNLDEVVVTALGIQRQAKAIGYATAKVDNEELNMAKGSDATTALSGKVSGLQINVTSAALDQETRVTLRGARSFKGDNSALLVLDGVQTPINFLQSLNPNDIDNISVLKGASAAALYGSEAANGVLIVTTKTGAKGKPSITYSLTTTMNTVAYLPKFQSRFGQGHTDDLLGVPDFDYYTSDENQQYGPEFDGGMIEVGSPLYDGSEEGYYLMRPYSNVKNGRKNFYENGVGIQHDISYSASDDHGSMYLSYQRLDQSGIVSGDDTDRQTVRFNASRNYKKFTASAKATYTHTNFDTNTNSSSGIYSLINTPGNFDMNDFRDWREENGTGANPNEWVNDYYPNPFFQIDTHRRKTRQDRLAGSIELNYEAFQWLRFMARAGINMGVNNTNTTTEAFHYSTWAANNIYQASTDQYSAFKTASNLNNRVNMDFLAFFNHQFGKDFELKVMAGYSLQDNYMEFKQASASNLALDDFYNLKNKMGELDGFNRWSRARKTGLFGSVDLSYKNWAFLQVTGRNDWTSLLDPSHWSFFYPSANASVVLSDAIPSIKSDIFNHFKIRASAAKVGTVNVQPYSLENTTSINNFFPYGTLTAYKLNSTLNSKDLEPEFTTEYEVGAEFGFFNNRITLEAATYFQRTTNQTVPISIPTSTGYSARYINAGTMEGKGLELDLRITPLLKLGNFQWTVGANATFINTKVTELAGGATELMLDDSEDAMPVYAVLNENFPVIKATDWKRNEEGKVIVNGSNGMPTAGDLISCGTTEPTVRIGLTTNMRWKEFSLGATFDYRGGHHTRFVLENSMLFSGASYLSATAGRQRFVFPNSVIETTDANGNTTYVDNTNVTVYDGGDNFWNVSYKQGVANQVVSAASWRLRELSLNYDVPNRLLHKIGFIQRASVSLVGRNLFMWTPKTNIWGDPDFTSAGGNSNITGTSYNRNISGYAGSGAASTRTYGFNILVSF